MGGSLSVYRISGFEKENLIKKTLPTTYQNNLPEAGVIEGAGLQKSILTLSDYNKESETATYKVLHFSNVIKHPIRAFVDFNKWLEEKELNEPKLMKKIKAVGGMGLVPLEKGYQEIYKFDVTIDFKNQDIFIFVKKEIAEQFIERLKRSGLLDYEEIFLDLSRIGEVPEIDDVWGAWVDSEGNCKKKAFFGSQIDKLDEVDPKNITSYNVIYTFEPDKIIDLCITKNSKVSSRSILVNNVQLKDIYSLIKNKLVTKKED